MDVDYGSIDPTYAVTTPELVHLAILKDAAQIANDLAGADERLEKITPGMGVFKPAPLQSKRGGLALSIDPGWRGKELRVLNEIGVQAVRQSILKNPREFVGLILGHARKGVNYFDRFQYAVGDQMELF